MSERKITRTGRPAYGRRPQRSARKVRLPRPSWRSVKLAALAAAVIWGWQLFTIQDIEIQGARLLDGPAVKQAATVSLGRQWAGNNLLTLRPGRLQSDLIAAIPEIKSIKVERQWPKKMKISITERQPSLIWKTGGDQYLLDKDGTVIKEIEGEVAAKAAVTDLSNLPAKPGERVVPASFVAFALEIAEKMPTQAGLNIQGMEIEETTSELLVQTARGFKVRLDATRGAEAQLGDLKSLLDELSRQGKAPAEYVDLRIEHKAYYK